MRVFVATTEGQGQRNTDFSYLAENELVTVDVLECDREEIDGACGCRRALAGLESRLAGTTARVEERAITRGELRAIIEKSERVGGWLEGEIMQSERARIDDITTELMQLADAFAVGTIVERRGVVVQERQEGQA